MKKWFVIYSLFLVVLSMEAQQIAMYNHFWLNPYLRNPAYAGWTGKANAYIMRNQRFGSFDNGTVSNMFTADGAFFQKKANFGLKLYTFRAGLVEQVGGAASYNYNIYLDKRKQHSLRLGVEVGAAQNSIDFDRVVVAASSDPLLYSSVQQGAQVDGAVGIAYGFKGLRLGMAVPQVIGLNLKYSDAPSRAYYSMVRHYMMDVQYDFKFLKDDVLWVSPHAMGRYAIGAPVQYEAGVAIQYTKLMWLDVTYKADYALAFGLGFNIMESVKLGYSYEMPIGAMSSSLEAMNHEFLVGYTFKGGGKGEGITDTVYIEKDGYDDRDSLIKVIQKKNDDIDKLLQKVMENTRVQDQKDTLVMYTPDTIKSTGFRLEDIPSDIRVVSSGDSYEMRELNGKESAQGLYIVVGVYSILAGAESVLERAKRDFPSAKIFRNEKNNYYYIYVFYSLDVKTTADLVPTVRNLGYEKAWILKYKLEEDL